MVDTNIVIYAMRGGRKGDIDAVMTIRLSGGTPTTLASGPGGTAELAVDATSVYGAGYAVWKVSLADGTLTTLASAQDANGIAVDATSVYWTVYDVAPQGTIIKLTPK